MEEVHFLPLNYQTGLFSTMKLQNRVFLTIELSKPFIFAHPTVLKGDFADVNDTLQWAHMSAIIFFLIPSILSLSHTSLVWPLAWRGAVLMNLCYPCCTVPHSTAAPLASLLDLSCAVAAPAPLMLLLPSQPAPLRCPKSSTHGKLRSDDPEICLIEL